jgi:hypothetical protein
MLEVVDRGAQQPLGPIFNVDEAAHLMTFCGISQPLQGVTQPRQ